MSPTNNNIDIRFTQCSLLQVLYKGKSIVRNVAHQLPRRITINKGKEGMMTAVKYTSTQMSLIDYQAMNTVSKNSEAHHMLECIGQNIRATNGTRRRRPARGNDDGGKIHINSDESYWLSGNEYRVEKNQKLTICSSALGKTSGQPMVHGGEGLQVRWYDIAKMQMLRRRKDRNNTTCNLM